MDLGSLTISVWVGSFAEGAFGLGIVNIQSATNVVTILHIVKSKINPDSLRAWTDTVP